MFKVGNEYEIRMLDLGTTGYYSVPYKGKVTRIDGYLIELDGFKLFNTASPTFESAIDLDEQAVKLKAGEARFMKRDHPGDF